MSGAGPSFNHAMIYVADLARALDFYADKLRFRPIQSEAPYYARLRSPTGSTTIALHLLEPGQSSSADGVRLYFEVKSVGPLCKRLQKAGVEFRQMPKKEPWGWTHAYLNDPDGHEISLYWAGKLRLAKSARR